MSTKPGTAIDIYHIMDGPLQRRDGRVTHGRAGVVATVEAMDRFVSGYRHRQHDIACLVLEADLAAQFAVATYNCLQREDQVAREILQNYLRLPQVIVAGDTVGLIKNLGGSWAKLAKEVLSKDPHPVFARMGGHLVEVLEDDRLLIYLNLNQYGRQYGFEYGEHWHSISRAMRGQRPMG